MALLERATALSHLHNWLREASAGHGRLAFVSGEMGIGKTTLVDQFATEIDGPVELLSIAFDGLSIPAPLGPLFEIAPMLGDGVAALLEAGEPRPRLFRAIDTSLQASQHVTVIVAEDAHWADDASLDLIRFLGRRIGNRRALVVVTFRDDELSQTHPLRQTVGDLATLPTTRRLELLPLSIGAVDQLASRYDIDPAELHAYTGGNPFFITAILEAGTGNPVPLQDAILGRAARLGAAARYVLEAAAAIGQSIDPVFLSRLMERSISQEVSDCLDTGLLRANRQVLTFQHAAVQATIQDATSPATSQELHASILECMGTFSAPTFDDSRLAFHAEQAGNRPAATAYAMEAARLATTYRSHREAAEQYARALRCADFLTAMERANLLEKQAYAYYLTARMPDAIAAQQQAAEIWEANGNLLRFGHNLRRLARFYDFAGRSAEAGQMVEQMYGLLERFPNSPELALGCGYLAEWRVAAGRLDEAETLAGQAAAIATSLDNPAVHAHARITMGIVRLAQGQPDGWNILREGRDMAQVIDHEEYVLRALTFLGEGALAQRHMTNAREYILEGINYAEKHGLSTKTMLFGSMQLVVLLNRCDWVTTIALADELIRNPATAGRFLFTALIVRGLARLRSGQASRNEFDRALGEAARFDQSTFTSALWSAFAERAWLTGNEVIDWDAAGSAMHASRMAGDLRSASELFLWAHRSGQSTIETGWVADPFMLEICGEWRAAVGEWEAMDMPLEAARALSASNDGDDLRLALATLESLGAWPDVYRVGRRLRALGYHGIPRGPRPSTKANPAQLTCREVDVLGHLVQGRSNREIAEQLYVSPKTVDHHVSQILNKLGARNRQEAIILAREASLVPN